MHGPVTIPRHHSEVKEKCQLASQAVRHLCLWLLTHLNTCMLTVVTFSNFQEIERLTVILYEKNQCPELWEWGNSGTVLPLKRKQDKTPLTQDALLQHTKCEVYQVGIWTTSSGAASVSISTTFCLVKDNNDKVIGASLDDNSWSFQTMQWIN